MRTADESGIYRDLMRFKPDGLTPNAWAIKAGVSRTVWADMRRHGNPSRRTLDKLLAAAGSSLAEFEALRVSGGPAGDAALVSQLADRRAGWEAPRLPGLPLLATATGGEWGTPMRGIELTELRTGELVGRVSRPSSLANDHGAYAVTIVGDSMWPRFRAGRHVAVSPKTVPAAGDDVLVRLATECARSPSGAVPILIKELVRRSTTGVELRQFNPDLTFEVSTTEIAAMEKIVGELV